MKGEGSKKMVEVRDPIEVSEAVKRVMKHKQRGEVESVSFHDSDWRRLAEPVLATNDVPSFDKSPYDGFALRAEDTKGASPENPVRLKVIEHIDRKSTRLNSSHVAI